MGYRKRDGGACRKSSGPGQAIPPGQAILKAVTAHLKSPGHAAVCGLKV
jgi:hypothetical protein